jgi:hypothetical protein
VNTTSAFVSPSITQNFEFEAKEMHNSGEGTPKVASHGRDPPLLLATMTCTWLDVSHTTNPTASMGEKLIRWRAGVAVAMAWVGSGGVRELPRRWRAAIVVSAARIKPAGWVARAGFLERGF